MATIREQGFILKIATGAAIGVTDESVLDPANMSSGSATLGQVPSADGAGGITWSDEIGPVPSGRQILNGTGITGGGDLSADRTLSVVQSALDPANMASAGGAAEVLTANGAGASSWAALPPSIGLPASSTDHALTRWDGTGGDTVLDSGVTLSDAGAMVFPAAGSISKPGAGVGSEAFGASAVANAVNSVALGAATVHPVSSGDSTGSIALGSGAQVGNVTPGAGCDAAVCIGQSAQVGVGSRDSLAIGKSASVGSGTLDGMCIGPDAVLGNSCQSTIVVGHAANTVNSILNSVLIGAAASIAAGGGACVIIGQSASSDNASQTGVGHNVDVRQAGATALGRNVVADGASCLALGFGSRINGANDAISVGPDAIIRSVSSGDSHGSICIGHNSEVGDSTPGAGCNAAVALGENATVNAGHSNAVAIGANASSTASNRVTFASALSVEIGQGLGVWGVTPPGSQPAKINDVTATAGASYTATEQGMLNDLKARVNSIIDVLEGAGLSSAT